MDSGYPSKGCTPSTLKDRKKVMSRGVPGGEIERR
jgi:hypothetical protein